MERFESPEDNQLHEDMEPILIQRQSPRFTRKVGEHALTINWYNTFIQIYQEPWKHLSHIDMRDHVAGVHALEFCSSESKQARILLAHHFDVHCSAEPTQHVLQEYTRQSVSQMDNVLGEILGGEEPA